MAKNKKKSSFRGKVSADSKRQGTGGSNYGYLNLPKGVSIYSPTPGSREKFDIIPYEVTIDNHPDKLEENEIAVKDSLWYKRPFKVHRDVGADDEAYICLTTFGKKCPICDYRKQRAKENADKDEIKALYPKDRNIYIIVPRDIKKLDEELHILDISWWNFQTQLNEEKDENEDYEIFPDPEIGYTLKVRWTEKVISGGNPYAVAGRIDFILRDDPIEKDIMDNIPDLENCLKQLTYEELKSKFFELDDEDSDDGDKSRKKKSSKKESKKQKLNWADLDDMDTMELWDVIKGEKLDLEADDYKGAADLRIAIADELNIEKPKKEKKRKSKDSKKEKKSNKKSSKECPEKKGEYGVTTDKLKACDECDLWDACVDEQTENNS